MIRLLGYDGHCSLDQHRCWLWVGEDFVPAAHGEPLRLFHGQYIRLAVPAYPDQRVCDTGEALMPLELDLGLIDTNSMADVDNSSPIGEDTDGAHFQQFDANLVRCDSGNAHNTARPFAPAREHNTAFHLTFQPQGPEFDEFAALRDLWTRTATRTRGLHNEPVVIFETWFLSRHGFRRCSMSRRVALDSEFQH